jgi:hypothetical protein
VKDRDMPKRKPDSLAASNNFLEVADNFLDFAFAARLAMRYIEEGSIKEVF